MSSGAWSGHVFEPDADPGQSDEYDDGLDGTIEVARQMVVAADLDDGAYNDPTLERY